MKIKKKYKGGGKSPKITEGGYDIARAKELGYEPDEDGHLPSRDYETGQYLKHKDYYTTPMSIIGDELLGYKVRQDLNGNLYSIPREQQYPNFDLNNPPVRTFSQGGDIKNTRENPNVWQDENGKLWQTQNPKGHNYKLKPTGKAPIKGTKEQYQAYQDSLTLYNIGKKGDQLYKDYVDAGDLYNPAMVGYNPNGKRVTNKQITQIYDKNYSGALERLNKLNSGYPIPSNFRVVRTPIVYTEDGNDYGAPTFTKPVQPITYQPEQPIQLDRKEGLLPSVESSMEFNPIPFTKGTYFTRQPQSQEVGEVEYFDKKTGKKLMENGGTMKKKFKKLKKANNGLYNQEDPLITEQEPLQTFQQTGDMLGTGFQFGDSPDNTSYSQGLRMRSKLTPPLQKGNIGFQPITQAPNYKQTIETPQINSYDFYNPQTGELNEKPQAQKPPTFNKFNINSFGGNKYFERANMYRNKALDSFSNIKKHGGMLPKAEEGFNMNNAASIAGGVSSGILADINTGKGFLDVFGNLKQNAQVGQWEAQQLRQSLYSDQLNQPPLANPFGKSIGENAAYFEDGGVTKYKAYNQGGMANVEVENMETISTPQGLIEDVHGATHEQGGILMNLPENSKIFSEKLKHPLEKKSFAKMAKKFETKKDIENLESPVSDKINKSTAELNILMKNKLSDELFQEQETLKLSGEFGSKVKNEAKKNYGFMKYGGEIPKAENGWTGQRFKTPQGRLTPTGQDLNQNPLLNWQQYKDEWEKLAGTKFNSTAELQEFAYDWALDNDPQLLKDTWKTFGVTNKDESKYKNKDINNLSTQDLKDLRGNFIDNLRGKRMFSPSSKATPNLPFKKEPLTGDEVLPTQFNRLGAVDDRRGFGNLNVNFQIPDTYPKDPIWTKQLSPQYIKPEKIVPYYNDIQRGNRAIQQNIGSRTGSDIGNIIQAQTTANEQIGKRIYDADVYNVGQSNNALQFNANSKMQTDRVNLDEFRRFTDNINKREAAITGQKKIDDNANIQRMFDKDAYDQRVDYISNTFNPSRYSNEQVFNFDPFTGQSLSNVDKTTKRYDKFGRLINTTTVDKQTSGGAVKKKMKLKFGNKKK